MDELRGLFLPGSRIPDNQNMLRIGFAPTHTKAIEIVSEVMIGRITQLLEAKPRSGLGGQFRFSGCASNATLVEDAQPATDVLIEFTGKRCRPVNLVTRDERSCQRILLSENAEHVNSGEVGVTRVT
jgi:hypothetical protein